MNDLYRGYEIRTELDGKFTWTDETGVIHHDERGGYETSDAAMDDIDAYRRKLRAAAAA